MSDLKCLVPTNIQNIKYVIPVSELCNEMQIKLAEEFGLSDSALHLVGITNDNKYCLLRNCVPVSIHTGCEVAPIGTTCESGVSFKSEKTVDVMTMDRNSSPFVAYLQDWIAKVEDESKGDE